ncbi:MAG: YidC/Oxa1 family membrane protein insertase [Christensenellaceae bacterium]|jgi:YidC/Oxa1 family membrane protein insertase|nr:YidC/Oxa1 family membrane protein insertase [Christensenellaceae bacterium]
MTNLLLVAKIVFPSNGNWIEKIVYAMLESIMGWGWVSYGFAIIIFTIFIKLIMLPLDFANKYFTKKNQVMMQRIAPEEKQLRETYANDPMALQRARQDLYRKQGVGQGGFCLVMLANLVITLLVFFSVFSGLRAVANYNIWWQVDELQQTYDMAMLSEGQIDVAQVLNEKYKETRVSFMWVKNVWRPDTWSSEIMSYEEYKKAVEKEYSVDLDEDKYNKIFERIKPEYNGWGALHWNGWLLLIVLAGGVTYLSTWLSAFVSKKNAPQKVGTKTEPIISYSLRDAKTQGGNGQPEIDPAQVTKMMQILMPIMMIAFAFSSTAAMAIYIIASSAVSMILTFPVGKAVDTIIKHQKPKVAKEKDFDPTIINPHAKYFKNKERGKQ